MCQSDLGADPSSAYWLFGKHSTEFSVEDSDAKGRREVLWTGTTWLLVSTPSSVLSFLKNLRLALNAIQALFFGA